MTSQVAGQQENPLGHALALHRQGQVERAKALYETLLAAEPQNAEALRFLGIAQYQLGDREACVRSFSRAVALDPGQLETFHDLAIVLCELSRYEEAVAVCDQTLAFKPDYVDAHYNRGNALIKCGRVEEALASYDRATAIAPDHVEAWRKKAILFWNLQQLEEALGCFDRIISAKPDDVAAWHDKGRLLWDLRRLSEALDCFETVVNQDPHHSDAWCNKGCVLWELNRREEILPCFDKAIELNADCSEAWFHKGRFLAIHSHYEEALECYDRVQSLGVEQDFLIGQVMHCRGHLALWGEFHHQLEDLLEGVSRKESVCSPFTALTIVDSPQAHKAVAEIHVSRTCPPGKALPSLTRLRRHERIRIGYFSSDFGDHPLAHLMAGVLGHHDRIRFEIFAFAFGPDRQHEPWRQRVASNVEHFLDVRLNSALEIAELARSHEIDIAIDLNGYTGYCQTKIFAERAAPVQASYIGYLGTMGAPYIDYLIADPIIIPEDKRSFYTEKIVSLPSYQANDDRMPISERVFTRTELGLPEQAFVFCSFNNAYKITPDVFDSWMRILQRVPNSVLWLYTNQSTIVANLKQEAEARGVSGERLVFASKMPLEEHLARQRLADLFLDTHPYNAGATASNALRVGLPVLTRLGESFPARMGASILTAAGIPELVTHSVEEYEALAVALATDPQRLSEIRRKLLDNLPTCALFDTARFTRSLEAAYMAMYERCQNDLPPDHITVAEPE